MNVSMILMKVSGPQYPLATDRNERQYDPNESQRPTIPASTDRNERQYDPNKSQRPTIPAGHGPK